MFLEFYGLREQPFGVTPNPRYLYHSAMHREALASLIYGIESDLGFAALIADPGMGKTTLLFYLLEKFRNTARTALIFQTLCSPVELLRYLANELEIKAGETDAVSLNERIKDVLVKEARAKRRVIVIIDEAQNLDESVLETIRLLSDFETQNTKLMHIILAGQLQLAEKLARPAMAQLLQRVSMLNRLSALNAEEAKNYVEYRLGVAGYRGATLFSNEAFERITAMSGGVPRKINRICFNALSLGCALGKRRIDESVIAEVGNDLDIGDLLFQKGAITNETTEPKQVVTRGVSDRVQVPATARRAEPIPIVDRSAVSAQVQIKTGTTGGRESSRRLATAAEAAPRTDFVLRSQTTARMPGIPATTGGATTISDYKRPFVAPAVQGGGIARPQPKPVPAPVLSQRKDSTTSTAAKPDLVRTSKPRGRSTAAIFASSSVLVGVIAFAGWTMWGNARAYEKNAAKSNSALPQTLGQEIESPVGDKATTAIHEAIERGRAAAKASVPNGSREEVVAVSTGASNSQAQKQVSGGAFHRASQGAYHSASQNAGNDISAALIRKVQPVYPAEARRTGLEGSVTVTAVIGTDGKPKRVRALTGNPILAKAATDAVSQWVYQPYSVNGRPVEIETEVVVDFALR